MILRGVIAGAKAGAKTPVGKRAIKKLSNTKVGKGASKALRSLNKSRQGSVKSFVNKLRGKQSPWSSTKKLKKQLPKGNFVKAEQIVEDTSGDLTLDSTAGEASARLDTFDKDREKVKQASKRTLNKLKQFPKALKKAFKRKKPVDKKIAGGIIKKGVKKTIKQLSKEREEFLAFDQRALRDSKGPASAGKSFSKKEIKALMKDRPVDLSKTRKQNYEQRVKEAENKKKKDKRFQEQAKKRSDSGSTNKLTMAGVKPFKSGKEYFRYDQ